MKYLQEIDAEVHGFADLYDELPLWSARFGILLLERVPLARHLKILDVGAGTGFLTVELAERCGSSCRVIAVDPWVEAMRHLRRKLVARGLENVELRVQGAESLELPNGSVDLIVSNLGINNFADPEAVLRTCFRVAKPGARLLLTTNLVGHMVEFYDVFRAVLRELGQQDRIVLLDRHIEGRGTVESVASRLEAAGFETVETTVDSFRMRFADGSSFLRHYFIRLGFMSAWKSIVAPEAIEETFGMLEQKLNAQADQQGELALTIPTACFDVRRPV